MYYNMRGNRCYLVMPDSNVFFWGYVSHVKNTFPQLIDDDTAISRSYCQQELHFYLSTYSLWEYQTKNALEYLHTQVHFLYFLGEHHMY